MYLLDCFGYKICKNAYSNIVVVIRDSGSIEYISYIKILRFIVHGLLKAGVWYFRIYHNCRSGQITHNSCMSESFVADRILKVDIVVYYYCLWMMFQGLQVFLGDEISLLYSFVIRYVIGTGVRRSL
jgi:hypothetical protein